MPQGRTVFGHEMKLLDDKDNEVEQDGVKQGRLFIKRLLGS